MKRAQMNTFSDLIQTWLFFEIFLNKMKCFSDFIVVICVVYVHLFFDTNIIREVRKKNLILAENTLFISQKQKNLMSLEIIDFTMLYPIKINYNRKTFDNK